MLKCQPPQPIQSPEIRGNGPRKLVVRQVDSVSHIKQVSELGWDFTCQFVVGQVQEKEAAHTADFAGDGSIQLILGQGQGIQKGQASNL